MDAHNRSFWYSQISSTGFLLEVVDFGVPGELVSLCFYPTCLPWVQPGWSMGLPVSCRGHLWQWQQEEIQVGGQFGVHGIIWHLWVHKNKWEMRCLSEGTMTGSRIWIADESGWAGECAPQWGRDYGSDWVVQNTGKVWERNNPMDPFLGEMMYDIIHAMFIGFQVSGWWPLLLHCPRI